MARHHALIERQATILQIEEFRESRRIQDERYDNERKEEEGRRSRTVYRWFNACEMESVQLDLTKLRERYPGTCRWLLSNSFFQQWFDLKYPAIPPLLWLCGVPGAGKTVLSSLVVEETQSLRPRPTVLYFYCQHGNSERNNFFSIARSLLLQFLEQDRDLLHYFYEKACNSGEASLRSPARIEELLHFAFDNCKSAYIIIDGVDECERDERKNISQWFKKLVEDLPPADPDRLRCLFVSQDDGISRKDFSGIARIKITPEDSKPDLDLYCQDESDKLRQKLGFPENRAREMAQHVSTTVEGHRSLCSIVSFLLTCRQACFCSPS